MNLLREILNWTETLPAWQRDASRRLLLNEKGLSEQDYDELYTLLKASYGLPNPDNLHPEPLSSSHLPASPNSAQNIILKKISKLSNVNRIAPDQTLEFSETGMSIVYGGNGSGKSGYVRVMKQACRSRDQSERVYPNAHNATLTKIQPKAEFTIEENGVIKKINWEQDATPDELLSNISVFDSLSARSYLTTEQDVAYLPYGLDIVENIARDVIPAVSHRLNKEIDGIDTDIEVFNHLQGETTVGKLISNLSSKTNTQAVEQLATLNQEEEKRITDLRKALAETDPMTKASELKRFVSRLKTLAESVKKISLWVNNDAIARLKKLDDELIDAEEAEKKAALLLQSDEELLPGTGEKLWKAMFEAAKKFSTEAAYPQHEFPHTSDDALCPLCQSSLDSAGERLKRFDQYVTDDVAQTAQDKRDNLQSIRGKIETAQLKIPLDKELSDEIKLRSDNLVNVIELFQLYIDERKDWILSGLDRHNWENSPTPNESPYIAIREMAANALCEARTFIKAADEEHKKTLEKEYSELLARQNLNNALKAVLELINRLKKVSLLEKCKKDLKTKPISDKSRELASEAVTKELKFALDKEFKQLGVGAIRTKLKERNDKGKIFHQLFLEIPTSYKIDKILSEGEQRAIALGSFLAELSLANHSHGIVFDDPVSSLDHWRRKHVARRLAQEAKIRQVIVFTHDTSFLGQLRDEIDAQSLTHKICFLEWKGEYSGNVFEGLPWGHSSYKERIDSLEKIHHSLVRRPWPQYPNEEDASEMLRAYNHMRSAIERVIQDVVFNGVVRRYRDWISIGGLDGVVGFEQFECDEINRLYSHCNDLVDAHDPSSAKNSPVPDVDDLAKDIDDLKSIIQIILARRKAKSK